MDPEQDQGNIEARLDNIIAQASEQAESQQPEPMPSSEETLETPAVDEEAEALENSKNPERTRAYLEKLKAENAELKAQQSRQPDTQYGSSVYDSLRPQAHQQVDMSQYPGISTPQAETIATNFVDSEGNVDINGLNRALTEAHQVAMQAREDARRSREELTRFEETQEVREAHTVHPEIDPMNKASFDPHLYELVRDRLVRNMWEGKKQSLASVANELKAQYRPNVDSRKIEAEAVESYKKAQTARSQGPMAQGVQKRSETTLEELRDRTRKGDNSALAERLKALGI